MHPEETLETGKTNQSENPERVDKQSERAATVRSQQPSGLVRFCAFLALAVASAKGGETTNAQNPEREGAPQGPVPVDVSPEKSDPWKSTPWKTRENAVLVIRGHDGRAHDALIAFLLCNENREAADGIAMEFARVINSFHPWDEGRCVQVLTIIEHASATIDKDEATPYLEATLHWFPKNGSWGKYHQRCEQVLKGWGQPTDHSLPTYVKILTPHHRIDAWAQVDEKLHRSMRKTVSTDQQLVEGVLRSMQEYPTSTADSIVLKAFLDPKNDDSVVPGMLKIADRNPRFAHALATCNRMTTPMLWQQIRSEEGNAKGCATVLLKRGPLLPKNTDLDSIIIPTMASALASDINCIPAFRAALMGGPAERIIPCLAKGLKEQQTRAGCLSVLGQRRGSVFLKDRQHDAALVEARLLHVKSAREGTDARDDLLNLSEDRALPPLWMLATKGGDTHRNARTLIAFHQMQEHNVDPMSSEEIDSLLDGIPPSERETIPETEYRLHYDRLRALTLALQRIYIGLDAQKRTNDERIGRGKQYALSTLKDENPYIAAMAACTLAHCRGTEKELKAFIENRTDLPSSEVSRLYGALWLSQKALFRELWRAQTYPSTAVATLRDAYPHDRDADAELERILASSEGTQWQAEIGRAIARRQSLRQH